MAIVFEQQKRSVHWIAILVTLFVVFFLVFAAYYLFFAPSPKIDTVLPAPLQRANQISGVTFTDPNAVVKSKEFVRLKSYVPATSVGTLGRPHTFAPL